MVMVHVATVPENGTAELHVELIEVGAGVTLYVTLAVVAGASPAGNSVTVTVKTCGWLTALLAVSGLMAMFASTYCLTAGPLFPPVPSLVRVTTTPPTVKPAGAVAVHIPAVCVV